MRKDEDSEVQPPTPQDPIPDPGPEPPPDEGAKPEEFPPLPPNRDEGTRA